MASMKLEEQLEEQPPEKKLPIDNYHKEQPNEPDFPKSVEENKETINLPSTPRHRKLPAELNREIFYCLNLATRRKFILGLRWDFYAMFRHSLLKKSKRLCNPKANVWRRSNGDVTITEDVLIASNNTNGWNNIFAEKGFCLFGANCRTDDFPGTICYYYEVKLLKPVWYAVAVGLTDGEIPHGGLIGLLPNSYAIGIPNPNGNFYEFRHAGQLNLIGYANGGNVFGCGILMNPDDKLTIFFTVNGILIGQGHQFPINPTVDYLIPTVTLLDDMYLEANFGDNPAKPFEYDIKKCPGMGLEWI